MNGLKSKARLWLSDIFDRETQNEVRSLITNQSQEVYYDNFYKNLDFGTGGIRGIMGVGDNRINKYTLGKATQGLSNYLKKNHRNKSLKVVIAYDCRNNSKKFAKIISDVFTSNGIFVYLFEDVRPTPELSFAVTYLKCDSGIVLTASHNPPEYNGYKVYWRDGAQIIPPHDNEIISIINELNYSDINFDANDNLIEYIGEHVDKAFFKSSIENGSFNIEGRKELKIVFTPLHGTSIKAIPAVLSQAGYSDVHIVQQQSKPNGDFPTVNSPNPEEPEALKMAIDLANNIGADIVIGTDPDGDRLGIAIRNLKEQMTLLNGNQAMCIMTDFLIKERKKQGRLKGNEFVGSTIVSTPMIRTIAQSYGIENKIGLTGFKWIAKMINDFKEQPFIGGGEESFGYMVGDFIRDKDAVTSALLACEIAAFTKNNGSSMYKYLIDLYKKHGMYKEHLICKVKKGKNGTQEIQQIMTKLREKPPETIDGSKVIFIEDYALSTKLDTKYNVTTRINMPKSNVLIYYTQDKTRIAARPSGTEPKIKFYFSVQEKIDKCQSTLEIEKKLNAKIQRISAELNL